MSKNNTYLVIFFSLFFALIVHGTCKAAMEGEIFHLLTFVENSECTFIRNNKQYNSADARQHIERKYNHLKKRINNTEQFIQHAASKSSISGKPYTVKCRSNIINTSDWLFEELLKYRSK